MEQPRNHLDAIYYKFKYKSNLNYYNSTGDLTTISAGTGPDEYSYLTKLSSISFGLILGGMFGNLMRQGRHIMVYRLNYIMIQHFQAKHIIQSLCIHFILKMYIYVQTKSDKTGGER